MLDHPMRRLHSLGNAPRAARVAMAATLEVLPDAAKISFRGRSSALEAASTAFGVQLPQNACSFASNGSRTVYWLGPDEWLLVAPGETPAQLFAQLTSATAAHSCSVVDVSHRSDAFALRGSRSSYILNHGCPLDLSIDSFPVGMCTRTIIGKAGVLLSRSAADTFDIDVFRSYAPYVWRLLDEARSELA